MKKLLLALVLSAAFGVCKAQEIGIRFGDAVAGNYAVDAVWGGKSSRIHADVSFGKGVGIELLWDMLYKPIGGKGLNLYGGVGPNAYLHDPFYLGLSGEVGVEYRFNGAPIAIGLDWRPTFYIIETTNMHWEKFGFNLRYIL